MFNPYARVLWYSCIIHPISCVRMSIYECVELDILTSKGVSVFRCVDQVDSIGDCIVTVESVGLHQGDCCMVL